MAVEIIDFHSKGGILRQDFMVHPVYAYFSEMSSFLFQLSFYVGSAT